jgi:two-component sensor histidine kinase
MLYERLNGAQAFESLSIAEYLPGLAREIVASFPVGDRIELEVEVEDFDLPVKTLSTIGLLVNELLTNALKYAFAGREGGAIRLAASRAGGRVRIEVGDDGIGLPASPQEAQGSGLGFELVEMLARQLGGALLRDVSGGTRYALEFDA